MASGGDTIPIEYHRKLLKKIAQLTKVIYALNTQNEEHEEFVSKLRSLHEAEVQRLLVDSTARLQRCEDSFSKETETQLKRIEELNGSLEKVKGEKDHLYQVQVAYREEVEEKLKRLKSEHVHKVQSLTKQLERFKSDQENQLKEVSQLKDAFAKTSGEQMRQLKRQHEIELRDAREQSKKVCEKLKAELASQASSHLKELEKLKHEHEAKFVTLEENATKLRNKLLAEEKKKWEEEAKTLLDEHSQKEEQLKNQISFLTKDLRASKDKLALAEQNIRELVTSFEENKADSSGLQAQLQESKQKVGNLQSLITSLENEVDIAKEQYRQQSKEMQKMSVTLGKLEALRVSNEGVIENLRSQITNLQQKLHQLETEQETLLSSQRSSSEQHSTKLRVLERELDKFRREKQELHAQFAREIEAAHAQLSQRETELGAEHLSNLQQLKDEHNKALNEAARDKETALEELKRTLTSQHSDERWKLCETHLAEISKLNALLADKGAELDLAEEELKRLKSAIDKSEQGLGSATGQVEKLRDQVRQLQGELASTRRQLEGSEKDFSQLTLNLDSLRQQCKEMEESHLEEMKRTKNDLTHQLEEKWKERLKNECGLLRQELSQRHSKDSKAALSELASLKDSAMKQAKLEWEEERAKLLKKIEELMNQLRDIQAASVASLKETKLMSNSQITALRQELKDKESEYNKMLEELRLSHQAEMSSQIQQFNKEKEDLSEKLKTRHSSELLDLQKANKLAVSTLRDKLEQQQEEALHEKAERHKKEMMTLQGKLAAQHQAVLAGLRDQHNSEIRNHRQQLQEMLELRKKETSTYERTVGELHCEIEGRDSELSKLRDKVNTLTVAVSDLRKELEVKGHEVLMIRREANNRLHFREQELSSVHRAEMDSLQQEHRHKSNLLLADFNQAKTLLNSRIQELEKQIFEWQHRYNARDSKPEDLDVIRKLKIIVKEQEQRMREFMAEKRFYQLELMNREKNYNKLFNANPHVGVLDPLISKKKKVSEAGGVRYSSAPSLVSPLPTESLTGVVPTPSIHPPHQLAPLTTASGGSSSSSIGSTSGVQTHLSKKEQSKNSSLESEPRRLVMLQDTPISREKLGKMKNNKTGGSRHALLHPIDTAPPSISEKKTSLLVQ